MRFRYDGAVKHFGAGSVDLTDDEAVYAVSNPEGMTYYEIEFRPPAPAKALLGYGLFGFIVQLNDADTGANEGHTIGWWGGGQLELGNYNDEPGFSERPYQTADVYADARGLNSGYAPGPIVEDSDLVFYFDFDDAGSGVTDESEYAHPATVVGDVTGAEPGIRHGCASFANGGYVDLDGPNVPAAHIPTGGFTLAAWLNVPDNDASHAIWNARYDGDPDDVWLCHPELRDGDYRITLRSSAGDTIGSITAGTPLFSEWVHYAATFDLATESLILYVNGEVVEDLEALETVAAIADNWDLGARIGVNVDDNRPLEGLMDEFYLFRRALSAAEVTELYTLNMPEPLDPDGDEDGDGVPNGQEEDLGTDPFDSDTDNDGVSDYDEIWYDGDGDYTPGADLNPLNSDTDGDGVRDGTEVNLGSDPLDPTDVPPLPAASPAGLALLAALLTGLSIRVLKRK
jgi:hypothetical protein